MLPSRFEIYEIERNLYAILRQAIDLQNHINDILTNVSTNVESQVSE